MRTFLLLSSFIPLSQLLACGPDCQSTCSTIYEPSQCGIERPGQTEQESMRRCMEECGLALSKPGVARDDYNPNDQSPRSETPELKNDQEVALWMDCVANTACENLEKNYCAPIW